MKSPHLATADPEVEVFDWVSPLGGSRFVSNVARAHILVSLFDGEPQKWLDFIGNDGTDDERQHDVPFLIELSRRMQSDPSYLPRLRDALRTLSSLLD